MRKPVAKRIFVLLTASMVGISVHFFVLLIEALAFAVTCFSGHMYEYSCMHGVRGQLLIANDTVTGY